jgi:hypothetical protein
MKEKFGKWYSLFPVVLTTCLYFVFYSRIESKPGSAGFWFILALGMSLGVALTRISGWADKKKQD